MNGAESRLAVAEAAARRHSSPARTRIRVSSLGRLDNSRRLAGGRALALAIADEGAVAGAASRAQRDDARQPLGGGAHRSQERDALRPRRAPAEGPHPRSAQVARPRSDRARARAVSVRVARRPLAARSISDATVRATDRRLRTSATSPITTTSPTPSTRCGSIRTWSTPAPISTTGTTIIDTAQRQKLDMICRKLRLQPGETMLDIGSGWGSLACHAAEALRGAGRRRDAVRAADRASRGRRSTRLGLADRVTFETARLRADGGRRRASTRSASVGMFEHVGISNFETYFQTVQRLLKPGGLYLHHAITRPGGSHAARTGKKRPEFQALTRYIFPGGELDYLGRTITNLELARLRGPRRRVLARALPAHHPLLARPPQGPLGRGGRGGRRNDGARLSRLSRRLLDHFRAQQRRGLSDAGDEADRGDRAACRRRGRTGIDDRLFGNGTFEPPSLAKRVGGAPLGRLGRLCSGAKADNAPPRTTTMTFDCRAFDREEPRICLRSQSGEDFCCS